MPFSHNNEPPDGGDTSGSVGEKGEQAAESGEKKLTPSDILGELEKGFETLSRLDGVPHTPARERGIKRDTGVWEVVVSMAKGEWRGTESTLALAEKYEITPVAARDWVAEGGRALRLLAHRDKPDLIELYIHRFKYLEDVALNKKSPDKYGKMQPNPDVKAALMAAEAQARLLALNPSQKLELTGKDGQPLAMADATPALALQTMREVFGEVAQAPALPAAVPPPDGRGQDDDGSK